MADDKMTQAIQNSFKGNANNFFTSQDEQIARATERMMGGLAMPLVQQLNLLDSNEGPIALLDNACGNGAVTGLVQQNLDKSVLEKSTFMCADNSEAMVGEVQKRIASRDWVNTQAKVADATDTGFPENSFSHVATALALHLIPDPDAVLRDAKRILKPGGVFGATTFHKDADKMFWQPELRSAYKSMPFEAPFPDEMPMQMHKNGHWTDESWVEAHLKEQGFKDVKVNLVSGVCRIESADEFVKVLAPMIQMSMNIWWSEEQRNAHGVDEVTALVKKHLEEKHGGKGWDMNWLIVCMTGRVDKE